MTYDSAADTLRHIMAVRDLLGRSAGELLRRSEVHDRTKLEEPEKSTFDRVTPLLRTLVFDTPEYKASLAEMGPALAHHYAHNSHHPEHHPGGVAGMDLFDLLEMACDWTAARQRHDSDRGKPWTPEEVAIRTERFGIGPQLASILVNTLVRLPVPRA